MLDLNKVKPGDTFNLAASVKDRTVGCVIIQAAMGCSSDLVQTLFDPCCWETGALDRMTRYSITFEEAQAFAKACNATHGRRK